MNGGSKGPAYDRQLLLEGAKRDTVLDLTEVQRYGIESWGTNSCQKAAVRRLR
jgi:hypothetical protein